MPLSLTRSLLSLCTHAHTLTHTHRYTISNEVQLTIYMWPRYKLDNFFHFVCFAVSLLFYYWNCNAVNTVWTRTFIGSLAHYTLIQDSFIWNAQETLHCQHIEGARCDRSQPIKPIWHFKQNYEHGPLWVYYYIHSYMPANVISLPDSHRVCHFSNNVIIGMEQSKKKM